MNFDEILLRRLFINTNGDKFTPEAALTICKLTGFTDNMAYILKGLMENVDKPLPFLFKHPTAHFELKTHPESRTFWFVLNIPADSTDV